MFAAIIIGIFIISVIYAHSRGVEKQKLSRQLFDHSTFMAPITMFMTHFSTLPAKQPYFDTEAFPELRNLTENWQAIREEAYDSSITSKPRRPITTPDLIPFSNAAGNGFTLNGMPTPPVGGNVMPDNNKAGQRNPLHQSGDVRRVASRHLPWETS